MPILVTKNLTKTFGHFTAVDQISFHLNEGEILGLLGPNGAGKTTTIQMLLSTLTPTKGAIVYFGKDLSQFRSQVLQQVAFASTYVRLPPRLKVWENLDVYGRLYGLTAAERENRTKKLLQAFGVWDLRDKQTGQLSAGETTRVILAKAFLSYPKVVLLDEPTASLDPDMAAEVRRFVIKQQAKFGTSILFTSHNMSEVEEVCDRVLFLIKGKIVADDKPESLAASVSTARVNLVITTGFRRLLGLLKKVGLKYKLTERSITVTLEEEAIATLLTSLARENVKYSSIQIKKPTLQDYFLQLSRQNKETADGLA